MAVVRPSTHSPASYAPSTYYSRTSHRACRRCNR